MGSGRDRYRDWTFTYGGENFTVCRGRANSLQWFDQDGNYLFEIVSPTIVAMMADEQWLLMSSGGRAPSELSPVEAKHWADREFQFQLVATSIFGIYKQGQLRGQAVGRLQAQSSMRLALGIRSVDLDSMVDVLCSKVEDLETAMDEVVRRQER